MENCNATLKTKRELRLTFSFLSWSSIPLGCDARDQLRRRRLQLIAMETGADGGRQKQREEGLQYTPSWMLVWKIKTEKNIFYIIILK